MIALAVFITLTLCMVAPLLLLKPSPLTAREVAHINECNAWATEMQAKLDAIQAKSDALTAEAAVPPAPTPAALCTLVQMVRMAGDTTAHPHVREYARGQGRYALTVWTMMRTDIEGAV